jgi:hypothetical protein
MHAATGGCEQVEDVGTALFGFEGTFYGLDLSPNPADPVQ